jgi:hypothetical protein
MLYESSLAGGRFQRLRGNIESDVPDFVFIEIAPEGNGFTLSHEGSRQHAVIGREAVPASLPSALIFELSRTMG